MAITACRSVISRVRLRGRVAHCLRSPRLLGFSWYSDALCAAFYTQYPLPPAASPTDYTPYPLDPSDRAVLFEWCTTAVNQDNSRNNSFNVFGMSCSQWVASCDPNLERTFKCMSSSASTLRVNALYVASAKSLHPSSVCNALG